jgi:DNA-binding transcriptional regulator YdaS (Cro superfamily)
MKPQSQKREDDGLKAAIKAAGGFRALARLLGISPQSLSEWKRVPTHRILQVEAVTKIPREKLRPNLYRARMDDGLKAAIDAADGMRPLARLLGITHQAIMQWEKVPAERILEIERVTGVARERLRPDLYRLQQNSGRVGFLLPSAEEGVAPE